jgi:hypothetical protein
MTSHNSPDREKQNWIQIKAKLISQYGQVKKAAAHFGCHVSALRSAVLGQCPKVLARMKKEGLL